MKKKKTLNDLIKEEGATALGRKLKVSEGTVRHWREGDCLPRAEIMRRIVALTGGQISYADMIENFFQGK